MKYMQCLLNTHTTLREYYDERKISTGPVIKFEEKLAPKMHVESSNVFVRQKSFIKLDDFTIVYSERKMKARNYIFF